MKYFVPKVNKTILKSSIEKYFVKFAQQKFSENLKVVQPTTHCCLRCWATNRRFSRDLNSLSAHFNLNLFFVCSLVAICWTSSYMVVCYFWKIENITFEYISKLMQQESMYTNKSTVSEYVWLPNFLLVCQLFGNGKQQIHRLWFFYLQEGSKWLIIEEYFEYLNLTSKIRIEMQKLN